MSITVLIADDHAIDGLRYLLEAQGNIKVIGEASNGRSRLMAKLGIKDIVVLHPALREAPSKR